MSSKTEKELQQIMLKEKRLRHMIINGCEDFDSCVDDNALAPTNSPQHSNQYLIPYRRTPRTPHLSPQDRHPELSSSLPRIPEEAPHDLLEMSDWATVLESLDTTAAPTNCSDAASDTGTSVDSVGSAEGVENVDEERRVPGWWDGETNSVGGVARGK
ncbi:uncharacterized protein EI97DRAFT_467887 [Westerdykella ornata]|uniref:Uncharacterized protein n=1 Tax=Westerdykella ornata TaxID=318751 RepID=A0A6A6JII6_WESOR|nr:uncharacterized protein EI97DRAFT_467887 [Westerdykella ornata]KAF2275748.1 hypothetical protein EI97DRAFT_467887 [Westerdykella ornata]